MSGIGTAAHFLVDGADDAPLDLLVQLLAKDSERLGRRDNRERLEIVAQHAGLQLVGGVDDPAIFLLLLEIGFLVGRTAKAETLLVRSGRIGLDLAVFAVLARGVLLGPEVDLIFVSVIAEEEHLAAVGDQHQRIVGKGHGVVSSYVSTGER